MATASEVIKNGLWSNNPGLVQLLGLCPLLAVSSTVVAGLGLGLATLFVLVMSNVTISLIRHIVRDEIRIPVFVLVIATFVTAVELLMGAYVFQLYNTIGIFIPLIVTNCAIIGRAEAFASKNTIGLAALDGLMMGLGFGLLLVVLGAFRELLGFGTLLANAHTLFGEAARDWTITIEGYRGFLLAALPPGAFIALGILVALKNWIDGWWLARTQKTAVRVAADGKAVESPA